MIAQRNTRWKDVTRRFALVQFPSLIVIVGFVLIGISFYLAFVVPSQVHESAQEIRVAMANAELLSVLGGVMVLSGSIVLLVSTPSLFKSIKQFGPIDKESSIKAERAGNVFFWVIFSILLFIGIIAWAITGNLSSILPGVMSLVFLLILRRAYVRDRLREIKDYKD